MTEDHEPPTHLTLGVTVTLEAVQRDGRCHVMATVNDEGEALQFTVMESNITQGDLRKIGTALEDGIASVVTERLKMVNLQRKNPVAARMARFLRGDL